MTDTAHRSRQPAGIRTGGQFATEPKTETTVTLGTAPAEDGPRLRAEFTALAGELVGMTGDIRRSEFNLGDQHPTTVTLHERAAGLSEQMDLLRPRLRAAAEQRYTTRSAQDAYATCYGDESYADYLEQRAREYADRFPDRAEEFLQRTLSEALSGNVSI